MSADGRCAAHGSSDGQLVTWDLTDDAGLRHDVPGSRGALRLQPDRGGRSRPAGGGADPDPRTPPGPRDPWGARGCPARASVAAVFLDPRTGRVVDEVRGRPTPSRPLFGSSVAVSPDRRLGRGHATAHGGDRPGHPDPASGSPGCALPLGGAIFVWSAGWTPDGSALLLGTESATATAQVLVVDTDDLGGRRAIDVRRRTGLGRRCSSGPRTGRRWRSASTTPGTIDLFDADLAPAAHDRPRGGRRRLRPVVLPRRPIPGRRPAAAAC